MIDAFLRRGQGFGALCIAAIGVQFVALPLVGPQAWAAYLGTVTGIVFVGLLLWQVFGQGSEVTDTLRSVAGVCLALAIVVVQALALVSARNSYIEAKFTPAKSEGLAVLGDQVHLTGPLSLAMFYELQNHIRLGHAVTVLRLDSPGGNVYAARGLVRLVQESAAATVVGARCLSACTLVFMAADRRILGPGAELGFHGYSAGSDQSQGRASYANVTEEEARDMAYLRSRGVQDGFLQRAFAVPHSEIWSPSRRELRAAGVLP